MKLIEGLLLVKRSHKAQAYHCEHFAKLVDGDLVMIFMRLERFPKGQHHKLYSIAAKPFKISKEVHRNACALELLVDMGITDGFNVENKNLYHGRYLLTHTYLSHFPKPAQHD